MEGERLSALGARERGREVRGPDALQDQDEMTDRTVPFTVEERREKATLFETGGYGAQIGMTRGKQGTRKTERRKDMKSERNEMSMGGCANNK